METKKKTSLFTRLVNLAVQKAPLKQYYLEIGVHFLKKGSQFELGQIIHAKPMGKNRYDTTVITGLFYNFKENRINHTTGKRIITTKEKVKG
ncbi:hypothetical protein [Flavobacterium beibuense]|uniref:hypothetical protein n=1 Tax=Flavobacterium beibuense TaxID=657326 RepID=UPI003A8F0C0D